MKKTFAILILSSFVFAMVFTFAPALAADDNANSHEVMIYYSEPIGGEKVYHITACNKVEAYAPLQCVQEYQGKFGTQCDDPDDINRAVRGCYETEDKKPEGKKIYIKGTNYPEVGITNYNLPFPQGCSDKPEQQGFFYGKLFGVISETQWGKQDTTERYDESGIEKTIVIPNGINFDPPAGKKILPMYQTGTCVTWDYIIGDSVKEDRGNDSGRTMDKAEELINKVNEQAGTGAAQINFGDFTSAANDLIAKGCNNNNGNQSKLNPDRTIANCSLMERLSGKSGSDVFAKYIGLLYKWAAGIVGIVAVLIIVASGVQISAAGADTGAIDKARGRIIQSIVGLAILFLAGLILNAINPTYFTGG